MGGGVTRTLPFVAILFCLVFIAWIVTLVGFFIINAEVAASDIRALWKQQNCTATGLGHDPLQGLSGVKDGPWGQQAISSPICKGKVTIATSFTAKIRGTATAPFACRGPNFCGGKVIGRGPLMDEEPGVTKISLAKAKEFMRTNYTEGAVVECWLDPDNADKGCQANPVVSNTEQQKTVLQGWLSALIACSAVVGVMILICVWRWKVEAADQSSSGPSAQVVDRA